MKKFLPILNTAFALSLLLTCGNASSCQASNWGYNPWTGGSTWLWAARSLSYPLNRLSTVARPLYLATPFVSSGSYYASRAINNRARQAGYNGYVTDQIVYAQPQPQQQQQMPIVDGQVMPPPVVQGPITAPPLVPGPAMLPAPSRAPLAQGFIDLVNGKYEGDISKALFDPQTRSYARAVGLLDSDKLFDADLSADRIELIKKVLADPTEDPLTKMSTVRMLLKM